MNYSFIASCGNVIVLALKKYMENQLVTRDQLQAYHEAQSVAISVLGQDLCEKLADWAGGETMVCIYFSA